MAICHLPECGRETLPGVPVCEVCRLSYLNGYNDAIIEHNERKAPWSLPKLCSACGHFVHDGARCAWHGAQCKDASADPTLWCPCDGTHPRWSR